MEGPARAKKGLLGSLSTQAFAETKGRPKWRRILIISRNLVTGSFTINTYLRLKRSLCFGARAWSPKGPSLRPRRLWDFAAVSATRGGGFWGALDGIWGGGGWVVWGLWVLGFWGFRSLVLLGFRVSASELSRFPDFGRVMVARGRV